MKKRNLQFIVLYKIYVVLFQF